MAASLDGVFRIIDRASPAMRRMERQALKTDAAITKLGLTLDTIGSKKQLKQFDQVERGIRNFGVTGDVATRKVERGVTRLDQTMKKHSARWTTFRKGVRSTFGELKKFTMLGLKMGGIAALIGVAAQGIGNLAGGVTALLPRFGQLTGLWGVAVPLIGAMAQTAIVAKVAFGGLSQAIAGNARALHQLAPAGQRFVKQWRAMRIERLALTRGIQQPLFSRINAPFKRAFRRSEPALQRGLGGVSGALGGVLAKGLNSFSTPSFLGQFTKLSASSAQTVTRLGGGVLGLAHGLTEVALAARPVMSWLTKSVAGWMQHWAITQKVNRENGKLARKFDTAKKALRGLWRTGKDIFAVFKTIMRAATPLGNSLYGAANRSMERWVKFHNTIRGREGLMRDFVGLEQGFRSLMRLVGALGGALFKMGSQGGLTKTADALTKMVPALAKGLNTFANSLGPALAHGISSLVGLFSTLGTGPLPLVVHGITALLNGITGLVKASGPFKGVFTTLFSTLLISRYLVKLGLLEKGWWNVAKAAAVAGTAESGATAGGVLGARGRGIASTGRGLLGGLRGGAAVGLGARAMSGARFGLGLAGKFAMPLALISGALGGLTAGRNGGALRQAGQVGFGALNALSFGAFGGATGLGDFFATPAQKAAKHVGRDSSTLARDMTTAGAGRSGLSKLTAELAVLEQHANTMRGQREQASRDYLAQLRQEITVRRQLVQQLTAEQQQKGRTDASQFLKSLNQAAHLLIGRKGLAKGFRQADDIGLDKIGTQFGGRKPATARQNTMRHALEQSLLTNAARAGKRNPALRGELPRLEKEIRWYEDGLHMGDKARAAPGMSFLPGGQMVFARPSLWRFLAKRLNMPGERQLQISRKALTPTQELLVAGLVAQGWDRNAARWNAARDDQGWQNTVVASALSNAQYRASAPGKKHAGGGRLSGRGLQDSVPVPGGMAAPGELVVNRHTESRVNGLLGHFGLSLGGMVGREARPHSASMYKTGGRISPGLRSGISSLGSLVMSKFPGLGVTSGLRPGDKSSYHSLGEAVDLGGSPGVMSRAASWVQANLAGKLLEGIHNTGLSVKNGKIVPPKFWGPRTWAGHRDHIHLAAGGSLLGNIASMMSGGGGAAKTVGAGALKSKSLGFFDPGNLSGFGGISTLGPAPGRVAGAASAAASGVGAAVSAIGTRALGLKMMLAHGWPKTQWPFLDKLWNRESGWRTTADTRVSGLDPKNASVFAYGIPQARPASKLPAAGRPGSSKAGPQIGWGLNYIDGRYGSPSAAWSHEQTKGWYARGGRTPKFGGWFGRGGSFTATGPTLIGVGERGRPERVSVSPVTSTNTGSKSFVFAPVLHVNGASQADVEAALEKAMHRFADIVERTSVEGADIAV